MGQVILALALLLLPITMHAKHNWTFFLFFSDKMYAIVISKILGMTPHKPCLSITSFPMNMSETCEYDEIPLPWLC